MRRLRLTIEYDGTDFVGWQRQDNGPSIQGALEAAMSAMTGEQHEVRGAGRTDAGVHALGQVAHVDTARTIPLRGFLLGLNSQLPRSISVRAVDEAPAEFDARHLATGKLYRYSIWNANVRSAMRDRFVWHVRRPLDVLLMQEAARHLVGRHDFASFRASDCERRTTVRTLRRVEAARDGELVTVEVDGDAFLKNMVRILSGTLVEVGQGRRRPDDVLAVRTAGDRTRAGVTAPALGLCLVRVDYPPDEELAAERQRRRGGVRLAPA
jgi:tRNA pseudouridine38-40 synthase